MTSPSEEALASAQDWYRRAEQRSRRVAEGTRKRVRRVQRRRERERLLRLGAEPAWVRQVLGDE
jgi:hypothetical protein